MASLAKTARSSRLDAHTGDSIILLVAWPVGLKKFQNGWFHFTDVSEPTCTSVCQSFC